MIFFIMKYDFDQEPQVVGVRYSHEGANELKKEFDKNNDDHHVEFKIEVVGEEETIHE